MTATLVRANCKLLSIGNSDSVPLVALLAKNLLIHFYLIMSLPRITGEGPVITF